jgi:hypothetical protein
MAEKQKEDFMNHSEQKLASGTKWAQLTGGVVLSVLPTGNLCGLINLVVSFYSF